MKRPQHAAGRAAIGLRDHIDHGRNAHDVGEQTELVAFFIGDGSTSREELQALHPFLFAQLRLGHKSMQVFDQQGHDVGQAWVMGRGKTGHCLLCDGGMGQTHCEPQVGLSMKNSNQVNHHIAKRTGLDRFMRLGNLAQGEALTYGVLQFR